MEHIGGYKRSQSISQHPESSGNPSSLFCWRGHLIIVGVLIIAILLSGRYLHLLLIPSR
jgi:hypothetical protein